MEHSRLLPSTVVGPCDVANTDIWQMAVERVGGMAPTIRCAASSVRGGEVALGVQGRAWHD